MALAEGEGPQDCTTHKDANLDHLMATIDGDHAIQLGINGVANQENGIIEAGGIPTKACSSHTIPLAEANDTQSDQHKAVEAEISDQHKAVEAEIVVVSNETAGPQDQKAIDDTRSNQQVGTELEKPGTAASINIQILKSVLYGGLTELIASLGIVTSAATTGATTGKIVALSLANLITGVFVMSYKISEHWMNSDRSGGGEEAIEQDEVDKYEEIFGDRQNHVLHLTMSILSFVIFGLLPPLVYGFTFRKPEDKILKIPAVTIVSVLCIGLLGAGKAYTEKPENCLVYVHIIGRCIVDAIGTSALTTFGGELIENYIEQVGWFDFEANIVPTLLLPAMQFQNHTWTSF